jgi:coenzyme F420-reducing hydrogenase delta subunit
MINVSAAMGSQFARSSAEFTETIKELGPNPLGQKESKVKNQVENLK